MPENNNVLHDQHVGAYLWYLYIQHPSKKIRHQLVCFYQPWLVVFCKYIKRKFSYPVDFYDYVQLGNIGLLMAIDRFDTKHHNSCFTAYARKYVQGSILKGLVCFSNPQTISIEQLQVEVDKTIDELAMWIIETSLKLFADHENNYSAWVDENPHTVYEKQQHIQLIRDHIRLLPDREYQLLYSYYYLGDTFENIGRSHGLTKARISQLHANAIEKLRKIIHDAS